MGAAGASGGPVVILLGTLDTKGPACHSLRDRLRAAGVEVVLVDASYRRHAEPGADVSAEAVARAAGTTLEGLAGLDRRGAAEPMIRGAAAVVADLHRQGRCHGVLAVGGANGTLLASGAMAGLPVGLPKIVVSAVGLAGAERFVGAPDVAIFPAVGDIRPNRITDRVFENAAAAMAAMARDYAARAQGAPRGANPLVGMSVFGVTDAAAQRIAARLEAAGYEVIEFHANGAGGRTLEELARRGELDAVLDLTTTELADAVAGGVWSAGPGRMEAAGAAGLPQVIVPGAVDLVNLWPDTIRPEHRSRSLYRYNVSNLLMRSNPEENRRLGELMARKVAAARGPVRVLVPRRGFSRLDRPDGPTTHDAAGSPRGPWHDPEADAAFIAALRAGLPPGRIEELDLHILDPAFADAAADALMALLRR